MEEFPKPSMMFFRAASMICSFHTFLGRFFFKHLLTLNQDIWIFYGRISESINELLKFFRAVSMICNFHTFFFKHLLTLNFNIFGIMFMSHRFFYPGQCGDGFLAPCPREALSLTSLHVLHVCMGHSAIWPMATHSQRI